MTIINSSIKTLEDLLITLENYGKPDIEEIKFCLDNGFPVFEKPMGWTVKNDRNAISVDFLSLFCYEELWLMALDPSNGLKLLTQLLRWNWEFLERDPVNKTDAVRYFYIIQSCFKSMLENCKICIGDDKLILLSKFEKFIATFDSLGIPNIY
jgi:hypothetical protein